MADQLLTAASERQHELFEELVGRVAAYNPGVDRDLLERAFVFASERHEGQQRRSGEDFILHPLGVAQILAELGRDDATLAAALVHDVVEDTHASLEEVRAEFGEEIATLVEGVTKLTRIQFQSREQAQAENYRKMVMAMAEDYRVILIKLADRLHNMRTIEYLGKQKQLQKARETLEVYAPLAQRLGIHKLKWELEDLAFETLHPRKYEEIKAMVAERRTDREEHVSEAARTLQRELEKVDIPAEISGRAKHFYSIYDKMAKRDPEWTAWAKQLMEAQADEADPREFMKTFRTDVFDEEVYVFTPKGEVKTLPAGATPIDFAYAVHTDVGHRTVGAKINGRIVPLHYRLKSGDFVEILTTKSGRGPSRDWLSLAASSRARNKIRQWFSRETREEAVPLKAPRARHATASQNFGINVRGVDDVLVRLAKCCTPLPGDKIVGYVSLGKGITIHREDCSNVKALKRNPERFTKVSWDGGASQSFRVQIAVDSWERSRLLEAVSRTFAQNGANIAPS